MSDEAIFLDGYRKALEEVSGLVLGLRDGHMADCGEVLERLDRMIERARCLSRSCLASTASGKSY